MKTNNKIEMKTVFIQLTIFFSILFSFKAFAQKDRKYPVSEIPKELLIGANAVLRIQEDVFTIQSEGRGVIKTKYAITILNKQGERHRLAVSFYDSFSKLKYLRGTLYDKEGKKIDKLRSDDKIEISNFSESVDDNVIKLGFLDYHEYPYTVEYESELITNNLLFYPTWQPQKDRKLAVQNSSFKVEIPKHQKLRYKAFNVNPETKTSNSENNIYEWKISGLRAKKKEEELSTYSYEQNTIVYTAPSTFVLEGYKGDMSSWKSFGNWINKLNEGKNDLPKSAKDKVHELVRGIQDKKEKTKIIYKYLQENTRYVSIQLGIGGWQPFKASLVNEKKYGDCKALTNYTQAMLKEAGIESYYTLVRAGENVEPLFKDFPVNYFNHAFLCVPLEKDTVWLECTSQTNPFGYLGYFTSDRDVLQITPEGGKIIRTPSYGREANKVIKNAIINLNENGNASINISIELTGLMQRSAAYVSTLDSKKQKEWLLNYIDIPIFQISKFSFNHVKDIIPKVTILVEGNIRNCASKSGNRLFLKPNLLSRCKKSKRQQTERQTDLVIKTAYTQIDTIVYNIPENFYIEASPKIKEYKTKYGNYKSSITHEPYKLTYFRLSETNNGRFPSSEYIKFIEYKKNNYKSDKARIVLVNKT